MRPFLWGPFLAVLTSLSPHYHPTFGSLLPHPHPSASLLARCRLGAMAWMLRAMAAEEDARGAWVRFHLAQATGWDSLSCMHPIMLHLPPLYAPHPHHPCTPDMHAPHPDMHAPHPDMHAPCHASFAAGERGRGGATGVATGPGSSARGVSGSYGPC